MLTESFEQVFGRGWDGLGWAWGAVGAGAVGAGLGPGLKLTV